MLCTNMTHISEVKCGAPGICETHPFASARKDGAPGFVVALTVGSDGRTSRQKYRPETVLSRFRTLLRQTGDW